MATAISQIKNLGKFSEQQLNAVGIHDLNTLRALGSVNAFILLKNKNLKPSLNFLYAMEAGLRDIHWLKLPDDVKSDLLMQLDAAQDIQDQIQNSGNSD